MAAALLQYINYINLYTVHNTWSFCCYEATHAELVINTISNISLAFRPLPTSISMLRTTKRRYTWLLPYGFGKKSIKSQVDNKFGDPLH